jgi:hypothetical protein
MIAGMLIALMTVAFAHPEIQPAKPGVAEQPHEFSYVISTEGAYRLEKGKPEHAPKIFHPAFVFSSESKFKVSSKPVQEDGVTVLSADAAAIQVRYSDGFIVRKGVAKPLPSTHEIDAASAVTVSPSGEYLLVRWQSDKKGCQFVFTLFHIDGTELKEASSNVYGCEH